MPNLSDGSGTALPSMNGLLANSLSFFSKEELLPLRQVNKEWNKAVEKKPRQIREGLYGAVFHHINGPIYLRMELLTEENSVPWRKFRNNTMTIHRYLFDILPGVMQGQEYNQLIEKKTGFTSAEFQSFQENVINVAEKTNKKVFSVLRGVFGGAQGFEASLSWKKFPKYVVYATTNPDFIMPADDGPISYKKYTQIYNDILIAFVTTYREEQDKFENRGIFRTPHQILKNQYGGLSMVLHGFSGAVVEQYFSERKIMTVRPLPEMQEIIKKNLHRGEGSIIAKRKKPLLPLLPKLMEISMFIANHYSKYGRIDLVDYDVIPDEENSENSIKTSALVRIYNQA